LVDALLPITAVRRRVRCPQRAHARTFGALCELASAASVFTNGSVLLLWGGLFAGRNARASRTLARFVSLRQITLENCREPSARSLATGPHDISRMHWRHFAATRSQAQQQTCWSVWRNCGGPDLLVERKGKVREKCWPKHVSPSLNDLISRWNFGRFRR